MIKKIMNLLAHLVELDQDRKYIMDEPALEANSAKAKDIHQYAMGMAHSIGCTIWCEGGYDRNNYQLIGSKGAVIDQTR